MTTEELYQWEHWLELGYAGTTITRDVTTNEAGDTQSTAMDSTSLTVGMRVVSDDFASGTTITEITDPGEAAIVHFSTGKLTTGTTLDVQFIFDGILAGTCDSIYKSREPSDMVSPRVEVKAIVGPIMDHSRSFQDGTNSYDAFEATLEITVVTNRTGNEGTMNHARLIGSVRSRMTMRRLLGCWQSSALAPVDLIGTGTADTFSDENDIDTTVLTYYTANTVKQAAWPDL